MGPSSAHNKLGRLLASGSHAAHRNRGKFRMGGTPSSGARRAPHSRQAVRASSESAESVAQWLLGVWASSPSSRAGAVGNLAGRAAEHGSALVVVGQVRKLLGIELTLSGALAHAALRDLAGLMGWRAGRARPPRSRPSRSRDLGAVARRSCSMCCLPGSRQLRAVVAEAALGIV